jgi:hypothetical protein
MRLLATLFALLLLHAAALAAPAGPGPFRPAPAKPNIVFILADDLGYGGVEFNGGVIPTPNLDRLAHEGVQLTHHDVATVCTPSRGGLLTGGYWSRFGVLNVQAIRSLPFDTARLPQVLKTVGYDTDLMGQMALGSKAEWGPNHLGFGYSHGSLGGGVGPWGHVRHACVQGDIAGAAYRIAKLTPAQIEKFENIGTARGIFRRQR